MSTAIIVYIVNAVVALAAIVGVILGRITWLEAAGIVTLLLVPSAAHVGASQVSDARARKAKMAAATKMPFTMLVLLTVLAACKPSDQVDGGSPNVPQLVEAGQALVGPACTLLEGITQNKTVISICATVEELATIAELIVPFIRHAEQPAGTCELIPQTTVCATKAEIGQAIQLIVAKRERLLKMNPNAKR